MRIRNFTFHSPFCKTENFHIITIYFCLNMEKQKLISYYNLNNRPRNLSTVPWPKSQWHCYVGFVTKLHLAWCIIQHSS
jgi:hypothetical protein